MMNGRERFEQDLTELMSRLTVGVDKGVENKLNMLKDWLVNLQKKNVVKINHSVMELVCAKYLILKGYDVQLEYQLSEILTCDLYSRKGYGNLIVEIETGFIPPEYALCPLTYTSARSQQDNQVQQFRRKIRVRHATPLHTALSTRLSQASEKKNSRRNRGDKEALRQVLP